MNEATMKCRLSGHVVRFIPETGSHEIGECPGCGARTVFESVGDLPGWARVVPHLCDAGDDLPCAIDRLAATREYVDDPGNWSVLDGRRRTLLDLIDGEVA